MEHEYLIWSAEHNGWWGPDSMGYTDGLVTAGRYTRDEAIAICKRALPTSAHIGRMSEIPVRYSDLADVLRDERVPEQVLKGARGSR